MMDISDFASAEMVDQWIANIILMAVEGWEGHPRTDTVESL